MKRNLITAVLAVLAMLPAARAQDTETEPVKPALLVIDIQNNYIPMMDQSEHAGAMRMINWAISQFRQHGMPVIRVYHTDPKWGPERDSEEFQFPDSIMVQEDDPMVVKNHPSAFVKTKLEEILQERDVNTLFLCGLSATGCVLATYFGAMEREYSVLMIEGAIMSPSAEHTETIKDILSSVGWRGLQLILEAAAS